MWKACSRQRNQQAAVRECNPLIFAVAMAERVATLEEFVSAVHAHVASNAEPTAIVHLFKRSSKAIRGTKPALDKVLAAVETLTLEGHAPGMACTLCEPHLTSPCPPQPSRRPDPSWTEAQYPELRARGYRDRSAPGRAQWMRLRQQDCALAAAHATDAGRQWCLAERWRATAAG